MKDWASMCYMNLLLPEAGDVRGGNGTGRTCSSPQAVDDVDVGREDLMLSCPCVMRALSFTGKWPGKGGRKNTHDEEGLYGCMAGLYP